MIFDMACLRILNIEQNIDTTEYRASIKARIDFAMPTSSEDGGILGRYAAIGAGLTFRHQHRCRGAQITRRRQDARAIAKFW